MGDVERRLDGYHIGITADRRWEEQAELLSRRGATILHAPTIRTRALRPEAGMRSATEHTIAAPPDVFVANTGIGLRGWFAAADSWGLGDALFAALSVARIYSRGPKATAAVQQWGLDVHATAPSERLAELVTIIDAHERLAGARVVFQQHGEDAPAVVCALERLGASVELVPVYEWTRPDDPRPVWRLIDAVAGRRVHAVTFTSAPAVRNLVAIAEEQGSGDGLRRAFSSGAVIPACVGVGCAAAVTDAGFGVAVVPERFRLGPLLRRLGDALVAGEQLVEVGGSTLVLRGTLAEVDGTRVDLAAREAGVLARLTARSGKVVSKDALRRDVWGEGGDTKVVEVTVARLRRRLGPIGDHIIAVPRRGYLFDGKASLRGSG